MFGQLRAFFGESRVAKLARLLLDLLPERERRIVALRFFDGLTQSEIAEQVGVSQMHVSRLLVKSLDLLAKHARARGRTSLGAEDPLPDVPVA